MVGTSGISGERFGPVTPSARSLPDCTCPCAAERTGKDISTCPPMVSLSAGPPPRYGMWTMATPATALKSSADMWNVLPVPAEAYESFPGWLFARATSSLTDFAGTRSLTTSTCCELATMPIGARSLSVS